MRWNIRLRGPFLYLLHPRTMTQLEIAMPVDCPTEQIAGMIYVNFVHNFRKDAQQFRTPRVRIPRKT